MWCNFINIIFLILGACLAVVISNTASWVSIKRWRGPTISCLQLCLGRAGFVGQFLILHGLINRIHCAQKRFGYRPGRWKVRLVFQVFFYFRKHQNLVALLWYTLLFKEQPGDNIKIHMRNVYRQRWLIYHLQLLLGSNLVNNLEFPYYYI